MGSKRIHISKNSNNIGALHVSHVLNQNAISTLFSEPWSVAIRIYNFPESEDPLYCISASDWQDCSYYLYKDELLKSTEALEGILVPEKTMLRRSILVEGRQIEQIKWGTLLVNGVASGAVVQCDDEAIRTIILSDEYQEHEIVDPVKSLVSILASK